MNVLGGGVPSPMVESLFHYGTEIEGNTIRKNSYWSDYETLDVNEVVELTGRSRETFKYRHQVMVLRTGKETYFRSIADKWTASKYWGQEYLNLQPIPKEYLVTVPLNP